MVPHQDLLSELNQNLPLEKKLKSIHRFIKIKNNFVDRISVALYDSKSDMLRTFLSSSGRDYPLEFYEARMEEAPSLQAIVSSGKPRVINDLSLLEKGEHEHTKSIVGQGYRASYTIGMYVYDQFSGFIFFNSYTPNSFQEDVLGDLDVYGHLISALVGQEMIHIRSMLYALNEKAAEARPQEARYERDLRLARISQFARLIALELAKSGKYSLTDFDVEEIAWFSPFHLLSKVHHPSSTFADNAQQKTKIEEWIDQATKDLGFDRAEGLSTLKNITRHYQENVDGSGYPQGLKGDQIPIEARIVCVADLFDAMTGQGAGIQAWSNEEAFTMLRRLSVNILDPACVEALIKNGEKVEQIQANFMEVSGWIS